MCSLLPKFAKGIDFGNSVGEHARTAGLDLFSERGSHVDQLVGRFCPGFANVARLLFAASRLKRLKRILEKATLKCAATAPPLLSCLLVPASSSFLIAWPCGSLAALDTGPGTTQLLVCQSESHRRIHAKDIRLFYLNVLVAEFVVQPLLDILRPAMHSRAHT